VIVEDHGDATLAQVRPFMESWLTSLAPKALSHLNSTYLGQMNPNSFNCPKRKSEVPLTKIDGGKKWSKLFTKADAMLGLFFELVDGETGKPLGGGAVQRTWDSRETIHLSFWLECAASSAESEAVQPARERLTGLIFSAFTTSTGLQGWVAQWGWKPRFSTGDENDYTPYEDAVGLTRAVEGPLGEGGFMMRKWRGRYLRGLSERLWLGPALLAHVDRDHFRGIAQLTPVGATSLRLDVSSMLELKRLEESLRPILPTPTHALSGDSSASNLGSSSGPS
jgi:hypothetical protein